MPRMSASCIGDGVAAIVHAVSWLPSVTHVNAACPVEEREGESEWAICHAGPISLWDRSGRTAEPGQVGAI